MGCQHGKQYCRLWQEPDRGCFPWCRPHDWQCRQHCWQHCFQSKYVVLVLCNDFLSESHVCSEMLHCSTVHAFTKTSAVRPSAGKQQK